MYCSWWIQMILCWEFLEVYILMFKSIIVKQFWVFLMIQLLSRCVSFDICHLCIMNQRGKLIWCWIGVNWLIVFQSFINHQSIWALYRCNPKSYNRSYVHFCVPCILEEFSNDPCAGTTNDFDCCLHWLSVCVDKCSVARPWFLWGLVGSNAMLSHL